MLRLLLLVLVVQPALMEVFTSIGHMSELLDTESDLLRSLDSYIAEQQRRLHSLRAWAESIQEVCRSATLDPEGFLGNPVNAYRLLKRLGQQWRTLDDTAIMNPATEFLANISAQRLRLPTEEDVTGAAKALMRLQDTYRLSTRDIADGNLPEFLANISAQRLRLPTEEDVTGAAKALMRLQDTYRLSTRDIADGNLPGAMHRDALSAHDCYDLGCVAYTEGDYRHTQLWMRQALRMMHRGGGGERRGAEGGEAEETPGGGGSAVEGVEWLTGAAVVDEVDVLDHLSFVAFQQGKTEEANALTKRLLTLDPSHERAQGNLDYFSRALSAKRKGDDESHLLTTGIHSDSSSSSSSSSSKRRRKDTMGGERLGEEEEEVEVEEEVDEEVDDGKSASYMKLCRGEGIKMAAPM
ncbi:prolyl 4-hydroxylase subunit alpha-1-like [Lethenteron reissneri]|uniref:prolyl 4-hydroxylase subunit alpha-1-like n=1 Tax=Lethenteron reissneri TaxID=7753 RepID=UPI002AB7EAE1|nr:prolyl 4-hydroxylase subunit alpha-1-like [Lethenteron reissneri]